MVQLAPYQIYAIGDQGITLDYGGEMSESMNLRIFNLYQKLKEWQPDAVLDIIPAYHSISLIYDLLKVKKLAGTSTAHQYLEMKLRYFEAQLIETDVISGQRKINIPVCYDLSVAPDLEELATMHHLSIDAFIDLHMNRTYRVYMIGFLPGFAYMGKVDPQIVSPRKASPRTHVAAGSVGIAGEQTGIYPFNSPGGWQIIGQTPLSLFDVNNERPSLLESGDEVHFQLISLDEFHHMKNRSS